MESNQTSVEWLIRELMKSKDYQRVINDVNHSGTELRNVIAEAKEMEKAQIIEAFFGGYNYEGGRVEQESEKYFNQTYGK